MIHLISLLKLKIEWVVSESMYDIYVKPINSFPNDKF